MRCHGLWTACHCCVCRCFPCWDWITSAGHYPNTFIELFILACGFLVNYVLSTQSYVAILGIDISRYICHCCWVPCTGLLTCIMPISNQALLFLGMLWLRRATVAVSSCCSSISPTKQSKPPYCKSCLVQNSSSHNIDNTYTVLQCCSYMDGGLANWL